MYAPAFDEVNQTASEDTVNTGIMTISGGSTTSIVAAPVIKGVGKTKKTCTYTILRAKTGDCVGITPRRSHLNLSSQAPFLKLRFGISSTHNSPHEPPTINPTEHTYNNFVRIVDFSVDASGVFFFFFFFVIFRRLFFLQRNDCVYVFDPC